MRILKDKRKIKAELKQQKMRKDIKAKIEKFQQQQDKKTSITLRLSPQLKEKLKAEAKEDLRSLSSHILRKLKD